MAEKHDPWMLDGESAKKLQSESKGGSSGIVCPKKQYKQTCKVCEAVNALYNSNREEQIKIAKKIQAKITYYGNFVLPANPEKQIIVEMGKQAGGKIVDKVQKGEWRDIAHPISGKGRCIILSKRFVDGQNKYDADADLEKAEFDVPKSVLDNVNNLDDIVEVIKNKEIFKLTELKVDESLKVRLLPPWNMEKKFPLMYLWRHWNVTQAQIEGTEPISVETFNESEKKKEEERPPWEGKDKVSAPTSTTSTKKCFGRKEFFDPDDTVCKDQCGDFRACGKACN